MVRQTAVFLGEHAVCTDNEALNMSVPGRDVRANRGA